jgi:hypothetical protein
MKVLLVVGNSRSGSTILANTLATIDGYRHVGELHWIWRRGLLENWLCGCGEPIRDCPFWTAVLDTAFGQLDAARVQEIEDLRLQVHRQLTAYRGGIESPETRGYGRHIEKLYGALTKVSGAEVIVDTAKNAAHGWSLARIPGIDLRVLHLVRDPRAVAYSWAKKKALPDSPNHAYFKRRSVEESCSTWNTTNQRAEWLVERAGVPASRLRYEEFAASPRDALKQVLALLSEQGRELDLLDGRRLTLGTSHGVSGNPSRFDQIGPVEISLDEEWKQGMSPEDIATATQATSPRLKLYGYEPLPSDQVACR